MGKRMAMRLMVVYLSFILLCMLVNVAFPMVHATGQYQNHAMLPMSTPDTFREPFKDFFDFEWFLQGSEYMPGITELPSPFWYGKWFVFECFWKNGEPNQRFYVTKENPITGTDSARMEIDGGATDVKCYAWRPLWGSPDPDALIYPDKLNPAYMQLKFRIDEWTTIEEDWRVTLGAIGGIGTDGLSMLETAVVIGLQGLSPPRLRMHYRIGDSFDWWTDPLTQKLVSETTVSVGDVHTLEIMRLGAPAPNGVVAVWLDGVEVPDLRVEGLETSFPDGGIITAYLGNNYNEELGWFGVGYSPGSRCVITFDDYRVRDEYIGPDPLPITYYDLTLDSSPQGKTVRVGNHVLPTPTPVTIQVPEGTVPQVGVDPTDFDHWEINPEVPGYPFSEYKQLWPTMSPDLMTNVLRVLEPDNPGGVGPHPTPAIYQDTRITAMYGTGIKHTLNVASYPTVTSFTVDELDYTTPWNGSLTEGTHTIAVPSTFIVGIKKYDFTNWEDDSTNPNRTVNLVGDMNIIAHYDETIIPEFPTLTAWLAVIGVATLTIVLGARKLRKRSTSHHHFHTA